LRGRWGFQWANTASRPRIGAFSGGAHLLDLGWRKTISWMTIDRWLAIARCADHTLSGRLSTEDRCGSRKQSRSGAAGHLHAALREPEENTA